MNYLNQPLLLAKSEDGTMSLWVVANDGDKKYVTQTNGEPPVVDEGKVYPELQQFLKFSYNVSWIKST